MSFYREDGYTREQAKRSVGSGWHSLIDRLFDLLEGKYASLNVLVVQVKEKFGGLRFYYSGTGNERELVDEFNQDVEAAQNESFRICEVCGQPVHWIIPMGGPGDAPHHG